MNIHSAEFIASYAKYSQLPPDEGAEFAFSGRSNVGKSSLINKLLNRKSLARTSSTPGKTATINRYEIDEFFFMDLPGYGYAKVSKAEKEKWGKLIEGYLINRESLRLVFQLIDFRHPPTADDIMMINFLIDAEIPFVIVFTKTDKLSKTQTDERRSKLIEEIPCFEDITAVEFSAIDGRGVDELQKIIDEIMENE